GPGWRSGAEAGGGGARPMCRVGSRGHDRFGDQRKERVFEASGDLPGAPVQLVERAFRYQPPVGDDADAVGHALGDLENMRRHDDGSAGGNALAQCVLDLTGGPGVEAGERLVEDDQPRIVHERARERQFLLHAAGKSFAALMRVRLKAEPADQLARPRFGYAALAAPEPRYPFHL